MAELERLIELKRRRLGNVAKVLLDTPLKAMIAEGGKKAKAAVDVEELPSIEAKQKERDALARAMEEFLSRGGKVQEVEPNVVSDPPKKPDSKYGSRPI